MGRVRRGFATQSGMDYRQAIPEASGLELDFVELLMEGRHHRENVRQEAGELRALADSYGVDLFVHLPTRVDLASPYDRVADAAHEETEEAIEAAAAVDAHKGVLHATTQAFRPCYDDDDLRDQFVECVLDLDSYAAHAGLELCVENCKGDFFTVREQFPELFSRTDVSMCFDTGHAYVEGLDEDEQAAFLDTYSDRISHVHLNDTRSASNDEHLPFGSGLLDFETILEPLAHDWTGTLSLEVFTDGYEYVGHSADHLDDLLASLDGD